MYLDEVVLAGLIIVFLTIAFFGAVIWAVRKDIQKHGTGESKPAQQRAADSSR